MQYIRVYADENGESHAEEVEVALSLTNFAPPAPLVELSSLMPSTHVAFLRFPAGWEGPPHPTPHRQFIFVLAGEVEAGLSDGSVRRQGPGGVALLEDTWGKGHSSRAVGRDTALVAVVQLPD